MQRYQFWITQEQSKAIQGIKDISSLLNNSIFGMPEPFPAKGKLIEPIAWYRDAMAMNMMEKMVSGERGAWARGVLNAALNGKPEEPVNPPRMVEDESRVIAGVRVFTGYELTPETLRFVLRSPYTRVETMSDALQCERRTAYLVSRLVNAYVAGMGKRL